MKLNRLDTHDRLLHFKKQQDDISAGLLECINNVPEAVKCPFYVWAHSRSVNDDEKINLIIQGHKKTPDERLIWVPRVTKPEVSPNSYLFLVQKNTDIIKIIWMLPKRELWKQYEPGQLCFNENIWVSIQNYLFDKKAMNAPDADTPKEYEIEHFRKVIGETAHAKRNNE